MSDNIKGKVVVITGASSGLGEATARLLSAEGAHVALGAWRLNGRNLSAGASQYNPARHVLNIPANNPAHLS
jgi:NADP-dependent 3-hydroxy acid dehydrogenase YdfG